MHRPRNFLLLTLVLFTQLACSMNDLPRNMSLKAFDPHRKEFICKHEADAVPPIDPEAEQWLQQGLALTSPTLWPDQRDYKKAAQLWQQAAERKHWKAMLNLASSYAHGEGVPRDTERAVQIVEAAMKLGIPAAYDLMGTYHMEGLGVKQDASRAYAFWELAVDMGSSSAMAYLGEKISGTYDDSGGAFGGTDLLRSRC
jgi:TPR repeat protein